MKLINNKKEFISLIETIEKNIVFCFHDWSAYSVMAKKIVEDWESMSKREIKIIDASKMNQNNYFPKWLINKEKRDWSKEGIMTINKYTPKSRIHGYGEICWIKNKEVVGFESIFNSFNPESLEIRTQELF